MGIIINHFKDPYWRTGLMESPTAFFVAHLFGGYILFAKDLVDRCFVDVNVDSGQRGVGARGDTKDAESSLWCPLRIQRGEIPQASKSDTIPKDHSYHVPLCPTAPPFWEGKIPNDPQGMRGGGPSHHQDLRRADIFRWNLSLIFHGYFRELLHPGRSNLHANRKKQVRL